MRNTRVAGALASGLLLSGYLGLAGGRDQAKPESLNRYTGNAAAITETLLSAPEDGQSLEPGMVAGQPLQRKNICESWTSKKAGVTQATTVTPNGGNGYV